MFCLQRASELAKHFQHTLSHLNLHFLNMGYKIEVNQSVLLKKKSPFQKKINNC